VEAFKLTEAELQELDKRISEASPSKERTPLVIVNCAHGCQGQCDGGCKGTICAKH